MDRARAELEELVKLEEEAAENLEVEVAKTSENLLSQRNHVDLSGVAQTSMRYELPIRGTSAVCTAYLGDLIKAGEISPSKAYLAVDPRKLKRARDNVMSAATERGNQLTNEDTIRAIMFDSRMDETKVNHFDPETGKYYQRIEIQDWSTLPSRPRQSPAGRSSQRRRRSRRRSKSRRKKKKTMRNFCMRLLRVKRGDLD